MLSAIHTTGGTSPLLEVFREPHPRLSHTFPRFGVAFTQQATGPYKASVIGFG